jgi:two-component system, chemotaxis family, protein-glutamate methylesterase/glutaminase
MLRSCSMASRGPQVQGPAAPSNLIVIGSSTGGLNALTRVLSGLPVTMPAAVIIVQHSAAAFASQLTSILRGRIQLPVTDVGAGQRIQNGHVYVALPGLHVRVNASGRFSVTREPEVNYVRPSADVLFRSAAQVYGRRVIAVVLTGYGKDGSAGVTSVCEQGGVAIVQDEATCEHFGMPGAAISTGHVQHVVPLLAIAPQILELLSYDDQPGSHGI